MPLNPEEARLFLEKVFARLFDPAATERDMLEFYSSDYTQDLNGTKYSFSQFMEGLSAIKATLRSSTVEITSLVTNGDTIAEIHVVDATRDDGTRLKFKVMAFQTIEDGRITRAEEVNCPLG